MKSGFFVLLAIVLVMFSTSVAYAQESLPNTANEGLNVLAVALAALSGLIGMRLTAAAKNLPYLRTEEKSKLSGLMADLVAFLLSTGIAYLITWLTPLAGTLDSSGLWQVLLWSWPAAKAWYEAEQYRKNSTTTVEVVSEEMIKHNEQ